MGGGGEPPPLGGGPNLHLPTVNLFIYFIIILISQAPTRKWETMLVKLFAR